MYVCGSMNLSVADNATGAVLFMFLLQVKDKKGKKDKNNEGRKSQILKLFKLVDLFLCRPKFIKYLDSEHR
jgi:hypothetical protein